VPNGPPDTSKKINATSGRNVSAFLACLACDPASASSSASLLEGCMAPGLKKRFGLRMV
jgi:hypothetical protein